MLQKAYKQLSLSYWYAQYIKEYYQINKLLVVKIQSSWWLLSSSFSYAITLEYSTVDLTSPPSVLWAHVDEVSHEFCNTDWS